jgi:hypothetical protein
VAFVVEEHQWQVVRSSEVDLEWHDLQVKMIELELLPLLPLRVFADVAAAVVVELLRLTAGEGLKIEIRVVVQPTEKGGK